MKGFNVRTAGQALLIAAVLAGVAWLAGCKFLLPKAMLHSYYDESVGSDLSQFGEVGTPRWMTSNLNIETEGSWCYDDNPENCKEYGRLYTWEAAKKACPEGFSLPKLDKWGRLIDYVKNDKERSESYHRERGDSDYKYGSGFSVKPGGMRIDDGTFGKLGELAVWWTGSEVSGDSAIYVGKDNDDISNMKKEGGRTGKNNGFSVRCIKE